MENKYGIVGVAHVGLPTNDLQKLWQGGINGKRE